MMSCVSCLLFLFRKHPAVHYVDFGAQSSTHHEVPLTMTGSLESLRSLSLCRRTNDFSRLTLNDRTILFLVILLDKTVSVG